MKQLRRIIQAFSLIELMVVVAILGILVSLALPRFRTFVAKARMGEAIHNLGVINKLQNSYNLHYQMLGQDDVWFEAFLMGNGTSSSKCIDSLQMNKLGFRTEDCTKLRYDYSGSATEDKAFNGSGYQKIYPGLHCW